MDIQFCEKDKYDISDLVSIVELLRDKENGCPWDKEQTHKTIRNNMLEETYEVIEAIDTDNRELMLEELGDVLLQVVFHSQIENEKDSFGFDDVCNGICQKLIHRHPHIFGDVVANSSQEVLKNWEAIKKTEKAQETYTDTLNGVSKSLPALVRSYKLQKRASKIGLDFKSPKQSLQNLKNMIDILEKDMDNNDTDNISKDIGEVLFATVGLARQFDCDAEECLYISNEQFIEKFAVFENHIKESKEDISKLSYEELFNFYKLAIHKND